MNFSRAEAVHGRLARNDLGPDLWFLIREVGVPLRTASLVTTIPSRRSHRASFRLTFADGRVLKARRVDTEADAERIETLISLLDPVRFPRVLSRRGRALLTEWIEGTTLRSKRRGAALIRQCGSLHAAIHRFVLPPRARRLRARPAEWEPWLDDALRVLVASDAISVGLATRIAQLALRHAPHSAGVGLCHGDFCAENIVRTETGTICVVDNESVAVDAPAYDLARTWHGWPMDLREQEAYAEGYGRSQHGKNFAEHFLYWALLVLVGSCKFRVTAGAASARVPLGRLRAVVHNEARTERLPRLLRTG